MELSLWRIRLSQCDWDRVSKSSAKIFHTIALNIFLIFPVFHGRGILNRVSKDILSLAAHVKYDVIVFASRFCIEFNMFSSISIFSPLTVRCSPRNCHELLKLRVTASPLPFCPMPFCSPSGDSRTAAPGLKTWFQYCWM